MKPPSWKSRTVVRLGVIFQEFNLTRSADLGSYAAILRGIDLAQYRLANRLLATTEGRDRLASLRTRYAAVAEEQRSAFLDKYAHLGTIDAALADFETTVARVIDVVTTMAADDIAAHRIYTTDEAAIRAELERRAEQTDDGLTNLYVGYFGILEDFAEAKALRVARRGSRDRWGGSGSTVSAALQASAQAGAINAATGLLHGIRNVAGAAYTSLQDRSKKRALFEAPETREMLVDHIAAVALAGHEIVAERINGESTELFYDLVSPAAHAQARVLVANVASGRVPKAEQADVLIQAFALDPFGPDPWRIWLTQCGDPDGSLEEVAQHLGVTVVAEEKQRLMAEMRAHLSWTTPDQCRASGAKLEEKAQLLHIAFDAEREQIERRADDLDRQARTLNGITYETVQAMQAARERARNMESCTVAGFTYGSVAEADAARAAAADRAARTFNGIEYAAANDVETAKLDAARSSYPGLRAAVIFAPWPNALITLHPRFSPKLRIWGLGWLALWLLILLPVAFGSTLHEAIVLGGAVSIWGALFCLVAWDSYPRPGKGGGSAFQADR